MFLYLILYCSACWWPLRALCCISSNKKCGLMPNVMVALPNTGGALCSMRQSLADAHYKMPCSNAAKTQSLLKFAGVPQTPEPISAVSGPKFTILWGHVEDILLLNKFFFGLSICALVVKIQPDKVVQWWPDGKLWQLFCILYFQWAACSIVSDLHLNLHKGHTMCASMANIHSATADIRPGKKDKTERRNHTMKI